jgi:hypothetical protein
MHLVLHAGHCFPTRKARCSQPVKVRKGQYNDNNPLQKKSYFLSVGLSYSVDVRTYNDKTKLHGKSTRLKAQIA